MSLHIERLTSWVELVADTPAAGGDVAEPFHELARQRAALAQAVSLEQRIRAEDFDD